MKSRINDAHSSIMHREFEPGAGDCNRAWGACGRASACADAEGILRRNKLELTLHLVWATWDRLPLITPEIERRLVRNIQNETERMACTVLAIGATTDHIHVLLKFTATITIAELVKQIKGVSSHFVNDEFQLSTPFKWQAAYGAFTVSRWDIDRIAGYVRTQKAHHDLGTIEPEYESVFRQSDD